ncbi:MAG TPA: hypothetical protein IAA30_07755 [Candidatus Treponema faecavium]|nr:hypothetical protein [Candidatus Treponema faecavium]
MMDKKTAALTLYKTLGAQSALLDEILAAQRQVRVSVTEKQWTDLDSILYHMGELAESFCELEHTRISSCAALSGEQNDSGDVFAAVRSLSDANRNAILKIFAEVRSKLSKSKIENESLNAYIRVAREFLQGIFDKVIPERRNTVYSNTGSLVKSRPECLVLDAVI